MLKRRSLFDESCFRSKSGNAAQRPAAVITAEITAGTKNSDTEAAYQYLTENRVGLLSEERDFDGVHGIMAYNRTLMAT